MAEIRHFPSSGFPATRQDVALHAASLQKPSVNPQIYCVYNQTQQRFVVTQVEVLPDSDGELEARLQSPELRIQLGLWLVPSRHISPASVRFPLDLIFLDADCVVLAAVVSFPLSSSPLPVAGSASLLILPADTLAKTGVRVGDRFIVSAPDAMKQHLHALLQPRTDESQVAAALPAQIAVEPEGLPAGVSGAGSAPPTAAPEPPPPLAPAPAPPPLACASASLAPDSAPPIDASPWQKKTAPRSWLKRLILGDPADPRKAARSALPNLIAYYFTGGVPKGHPVRNISATGIFIITEDRWYPGTVVRVTLTDQRRPTAERSITVNAKAVRSGGDGVGLEFVLNQRLNRKSSGFDEMEWANGMDPAEVEQFLRSYQELPPRS